MTRAIRALAATPALALSATLTLALGIGGITTIFSIVNALLLRPLPVAAPERLAAVSTEFAATHGFTAGAGWNFATFEAMRRRSAAFDGVLAWQSARFAIGRGGESAVVDGVYASDEFFSTLGVRPARGRVFTQDDAAMSPPLAVISHRLWKTRFGGADDIVGAPLVVNGGLTAIAGVLPPAFQGLEAGRATDVILSFGAERALRGANAPLFRPHSYTLLVMLRLKPGQSIAAATAALRSLQSEIVPADAPAFATTPFVLVPVASASNPGSAQQVYGRSVLIMLGGAGLLFLTSCFNVANLLLARASGRRRETALRTALGAPLSAVVRPLVIEHALIAAAGTVLGVLISRLGVSALLSLTAVSIDSALDWRVMAFAAGTSVVALLLLTPGPVRRAARIQPAAILKEAGDRATTGGGRLSSGLVLVQVAVAVLLTIPAALLMQTFVRLAHRPLGFDADRVLVVNVDATRSTAPAAARDLLFGQVLDIVRALPGVAQASLSYWSPVGGGGGLSSAPIADLRGSGEEVNVVTNFVGPGWFQTYGIPLRLGRDFDARDGATAPRAVVVNESFVRRLLSSGPPVGVATTRGVIIGVVGDAVSRSAQRIPGVASQAFRDPVPPTMYSALAQVPASDRPRGDAIRLNVRAAAGSPAALVSSIGSALTALDDSLVLEFHTLVEDVDRALAQERLSAIVVAVFASLTLVLALVGVFGVTSDAASRRRAEIGLRMALGATRGDIVRLVLRRTVPTIVAGVAIGTAAAAAMTRVISTQLFAIDRLDPATFVALPAGVGLLTAAFALIPAMRAATRNPLAVLRGRD